GSRVIIDDELTSNASKAIQDIDKKVTQLKIQNRASNTRTMAETGERAPSISGITLDGVDQMRKRLQAWLTKGWAKTPEDGRAAQAVIDAFDARIDRAIANGEFTGDPRIVEAWKAARAAHAEHRSTFGGGKRDAVGDVIQKIIGNQARGIEAHPPEKVA